MNSVYCAIVILYQPNPLFHVYAFIYAFDEQTYNEQDNVRPVGRHEK